MAHRSNSGESFNEYVVVAVEDVLTWELIDLSDDDCVVLDNFSLCESSDSSFLVENENLADDVISLFEDVTSAFKGEEEPSSPDLASPSADICVQSLLDEFQPTNLGNKGVGEDGGDDDHNRDQLAKVPWFLELDQHLGAIIPLDYECENYDDDYEHGDEDEYDDELVPLHVRNRFGRQRIRKMGKRVCPKMNRSKKLPYKYNRPGCVHGKHGLGVQYAHV